MILTLGNIFLMGLRWLCRTIRYERYARAMQDVMQHTSLFIERAESKSQATIVNMKLLTSSTSFKGLGRTLMEDGCLRLHLMNSKAEIDLSDWIAYKVRPNLQGCDIRVLVEATEPLVEGQMMQNTPVFDFDHLHILTCGTILAWKVEEPVGIILACDLSGLVRLVDAFGQDNLVVDQGFQIAGLATVTTKNFPQYLISNEEDVLSVSPGLKKRIMHTFPSPGNKESETSPEIYERTKVSDSFTTGSRSPLPSSPMCSQSQDSPDRPQEGKHSTTSPKTGGNRPQEGKHSSTSPKTGAVQSNSKPPNILIYCGVKDSVRKFSEAKSSLQSCINADAYAIYHLSHDNLLHSPWQENTALLVITCCPHLRSDAEETIYDFAQSAHGSLISFGSSIDNRFAVETAHDDVRSEGFTTFSYKSWKGVSSVSGAGLYSGNCDPCMQVMIPVEASANKSVTAESQSSKSDSDSSGVPDNSNDQRETAEYGSQKALAVRISQDNGGIVILSKLLLERDPASIASDDKSFTILKKSNTERLEVLREFLRLLGIDTDPGSIPRLTYCHLLARQAGLRDSFLCSFRHRLNEDRILKSKDTSLRFLPSCPPEPLDIQPSLLPVVTDSSSKLETELFDLPDYWTNLETTSLGQIVFYTDVITSTMTVFDSLLFSIPHGMAPVAIAGRQTSGQGRGGNAWLSPVGCAMFTLPMTLSLNSELGSRVSFLQHLVAVAVVQSVVTLPGYQSLNIRLKWPNDIYYGKEIKLGGVLVKSTLMADRVYATIGCGFNVSNANPTTCINDIIRHHNASQPHSRPLEPLTSGQLVARTLTILEGLVEGFQRDGGSQFCQLYYKYWLHGGSKVKVKLETETEGEIIGLDEYGFLSLRTEDGDLISVQPDGNSFDMLRNLIHLKAR